MLAQDKYIVSTHSLLSPYLRQKEQISYRYSIYVCSQAKKIMYGCYYLNFLGMAKKILAYENLCFLASQVRKTPRISVCSLYTGDLQTFAVFAQ